MDTSEVVGTILKHYGVKGMRWGRRRNLTSEVTVIDKKKRIKTKGGEGLPADPKAVRARVIGQKAKKSGLKSLTDDELREYANRLSLEQNVKRLQFSDKPAAEQFARKLIGQTGQTTANDIAKDVAGTRVKKVLTRRIL